MVSMFVHAVLGIAVVWFTIAQNPKIFSRPSQGPWLSPLEIAYWAIALVSLPLCWYFNYQFVQQYATEGTNPIWGQGSWQQFIALGYANPAASSASADYTLINVILLPLFTIVDGRRRGIRHPWTFFVSSLFTSCVFAYAFYFATIERQRRHKLATSPAESVV